MMILIIIIIIIIIKKEIKNRKQQKYIKQDLIFVVYDYYVTIKLNVYRLVKFIRPKHTFISYKEHNKNTARKIMSFCLSILS